MTADFDEELERLKKSKIKEMMEDQKSREVPNSPVKVTDENVNRTLNEYPLTVIDFWAEWCAPCRAMEPVIERLAQKYSGKILFGKLNVDKNPITSSRFQITSIPSIWIFKGSKPVDRAIGVTSERQLESKFEKYL